MRAGWRQLHEDSFIICTHR